MVVPLRTVELPRIFVANFLRDPPTADEHVVFLCGSEWDHARRGRLIELVTFYALPASVIEIPEPMRATAALRAAITMTEAEEFLLCSPGMLGQPGWREALYRAARGAAAACPTVLYEDRSVRFAGAVSIAVSDRPPFATLDAPFTGLSAEFVDSGPAQPTEIGTLACCLLRRRALAALEAADRLTTEAGQEAALFLALREAGLSRVWLPSVQVTAPEEDLVSCAPAAALVDSWIVRKAWEERTGCAS